MITHYRQVSLGVSRIPFLCYVDELGATNLRGYAEDDGRANDNHWIHRPTIDWEKAENRNKSGTVEYTLFFALKKMIAVRKEIAAFADFNNRELIDVENDHLFAFIRFNHEQLTDRVLVVCNFDAKNQYLDLQALNDKGFSFYGQLSDLYSGRRPPKYNDRLVLQPYQFYWLTNI